jgi:hypothetical protein
MDSCRATIQRKIHRKTVLLLIRNTIGQSTLKSSASLDRIQVATPCPVSWADMHGDERVRFCDHCKLNVYNISQMTRGEAKTLISSAERRFCARLYRRSDGTILTKDCPVGLRALHLRLSKRVAAVFAAIVSISSTAFGQHSAAKKQSCTPQVKIAKSVSDQSESSIAIVVLDPNGAVIPGAVVELIKDGNLVRSGGSGDNGQVRFDSVAAGNYALKVKMQGFKNLEVNKIVVAKQQNLRIDAILQLSGDYETVGLLAFDDDFLDTSSSSVQTKLSGDLIRKLPIN